MKLLPIDSLNIFSHPGVSASVLLGTAGSIYLLLQSVKLVSKRTPKRSSKVIDNKFCGICDTKVENLVDFVTCKGCTQYVCQNQKCSEYNLELETWECVKCKKNRVIQQKTGEFFLKHLNELEDQTLVHLVRDTINKWNDGQDVAIEITKSQLHAISKFVEQILIKKIESALAIESSNDQSHQQQLTAANATSSSDYYTDLKRFITHICEEVMKITNALDIAGMPPREQKNSEQQTLSETTQSQSSELEHQDKISVSMAIADKTIEEQPAIKITNSNSWKVDDNQNHISISSGGAKEIQVKSECEKCKAKSVSSQTIFERLNSTYDDDMQHLSDCVENHSVALPDLSSDSDLLISEDHELDVTNLMSETSWEDNWQLREIMRNNTHGIAMLIPSPTEEVRAQIGDRSADEYDSDLSENEIEFEEENSDNEILQNFCYSTTLHIMTKSPLATTKTIPIEAEIIESSNNEESMFTSMIDIASPEPSLKEELKFDKTESDIKFPVITSPTITIDSVVGNDDEELFDSIVETSSISDHKKSIDEAFESILKAEEKISKDILDTAEALKREEETARKNRETLENLLREEELATRRIHEAVNVSAAIKEENLLPVGKIHEAINGTAIEERDPHIKYRKVEVDVDNRTRYSPLFKNYNFSPIKPVKVIENSTSPQSAPITTNIFDPFPCHTFSNNHPSNIRPKSIASIPEDDSINNLLHTASLISRSRTDLSISSDENVLINKDPEKVLMENLVPGSIAEREHIKWLHAAPIENNPYSPDVLERRLSETHSKQKVIDIHALLQQHEPPVLEEKIDEVIPVQQQRPNIIKYKRDYYINDNGMNLSPSPTSSIATSSPISPKPITPTLDVKNDEIIKPNKKAYEEMTVSMLIGDMEMPLKYTRHDQDYSLTTLNSLTMSEDSETTRIYTPSTQETKLIAPHAERISTTKGFPVATSDETEIDKIDDSSIKDEIVHEDVYEERQVIEPEVLEHLPSVRKLAELYKQESSSEIINNSTNNPITQQLSRSGSSNLMPPRNYPMPIASITARTLPAQVRADLKQSFAIEDQESYVVRYDDPEPDPEIQPGMTKSSIAFFENLMK